MSYAYRCETCNGIPWWRIDRVGDAVVSWACKAHLSEVCWGLQRPFHRTELLVKHNWGGVDNKTAPLLGLEPRSPGPKPSVLPIAPQRNADDD